MDFTVIVIRQRQGFSEEDMLQLSFNELASATGWRLEGREAITHTGRLVKGRN